MITVSALNEIIRVRHAFFTRDGGVSQGLYAGLNCGYGSGDDAALVTANRARAMAMLEQPAEALVTVQQQHTPDAVTVEAPWPTAGAPVADAMVTKVPGVVLGILTADCAPVLLADSHAGVVAAAHAGWKGALGGVVENTLAAMEAIGASRSAVVAAVGPCIAQRSYEVGPDFPAPFLALDPANALFFAPAQRAGHHMFDLPAYVARRLAAAGVGQVIRMPSDTLREESRFFSYRRATLRGEKVYGRQLSAIVLEQ
jgi:YfiH family protein